MRGWLAAALLVAACGAGRRIDLDFTAARPADLESIAGVELEVWPAASCTCAELDSKPGCMSADRIATLSFAPGADRRSAGDLPEGSLVVRVRAIDAASNAVPLRINCWCTAERGEQTLVYSLGTPLDPSGAGCD